MIRIVSVLLMYLVSVVTFSQSQTEEGVATLKVTVENVSGTEGHLQFALHSKETFLKSPIMTKTGEIAGKQSTVTFKNIPAGEYAIICYHDKNDNKRMDFEANGMPLEDYGATNNVMSMGPPVFQDAKFTVGKENLELGIRF